GRTSIALDSSEQPHISYYDNGSDDLWYAYYGPTGIEGDEFSQGPVQLLGAYPNPSSGSVELRFILSSDSSVDIQLFDVSGRMVNSTSSEYEQGQNSFVLRDLRSAVYLVQLRSGGFTATEQFLIIN
ncbi:MAG: T9SS type A sorting domain-containing protein, partial [Candidatus Sabulitectum sp.]|nr:T9SS type A sorting domain-containing protein [Candidatus Sabulitectum sp.]